MLDAHPEIVCSGEGAFFERLIQPIIGVRAEYGAYMKRANQTVYNGNGSYGEIPFDEVREPLRQIVFNMMNKRAVANTKAVGDKTPRNNLFLKSMFVMFPEARFINIVRHPCDVALSRLFHTARAGRTEALEPNSALRTSQVEGTALNWTEVQRRVIEFQTLYPGVLVDVRYEDLIEAPVREACRLFRHLGVADDEVTALAAVDMASFEKLSGGRRRGTEDPGSFFRKGIAGDWKDGLEPELARLIFQHCRPLMQHYGYEAPV